MPVTGEIAELPLPELLNMMRFRAGRLTLLQTQHVSEMVLHFTPGYLCGFQVEGRILKSEPQVIDKLVTVTAFPLGKFVFEPRHASSLRGSVRINIDRLALIIVSKLDELSVNKSQLPAPHRIFRLLPQDAEQKLEFEDADLENFFQSAESLLRCGLSPEKLASIEQISVEQVQLYIYKLALLNVVGPARRDELWAQLDQVLEAKSTPLQLSPNMDPQAVPPPPARNPDPKRLAPSLEKGRPPLVRPQPVVTPAIGLGSLHQRKIMRLTGPATDPAEEDPLPPAA